MLIQVDGFALWLHFELHATANLQVVEQIEVTTFQKPMSTLILKSEVGLHLASTDMAVLYEYRM